MRSPRISPVLLLTATIDPGATPFVARKDPLARLLDYQQSLTAWLSSGSIQKIVLYENSGYDITSLREIAGQFPNHEVEFHSFQGNDAGASKGKGYPELLGIERVIAQSSLIQNCRCIAKCTGRLTVANGRKLFRLIDSLGVEPFDIMCMMSKNFTFADSRFFVATPAFVSQYLIPLREIIDDNRGVFFEHALACAAAKALSERKRWLPFPILPDIRGISGTFDVSHRMGGRRRVQEAIFHRLRNYLNDR
jgi:hypothetical protein